MWPLLCSKSVRVPSLGSLLYRLILSVKRDSWTSSFPICIPFISCSGTLIQLRLQALYYIRHWENGHSCLVPDLIRNISSSSPSGVVLTIGLTNVSVMNVYFIIHRFEWSPKVFLWQKLCYFSQREGNSQDNKLPAYVRPWPGIKMTVLIKWESWLSTATDQNDYMHNTFHKEQGITTESRDICPGGPPMTYGCILPGWNMWRTTL